MSTPEMARRLARLGGVASVNPYYIYGRSEFSAPYAYTAARLRSLVDAGVPTAMHTDSPVVSPLPLEEVWLSVNRSGLSGKVPRTRRARHRRPSAANGHLRRRAYLGVEDRVGSIATGKFADFAGLRSSVGNVFPASEIRPR